MVVTRKKIRWTVDLDIDDIEIADRVFASCKQSRTNAVAAIIRWLKDQDQVTRLRVLGLISDDLPADKPAAAPEPKRVGDAVEQAVREQRKRRQPPKDEVA